MKCENLNFIDFLLMEAGQKPQPLKPVKKLYDVIKSEPAEKKDISKYHNIDVNLKKALLKQIHKQFIEDVRALMSEFDFPADLKKQIHTVMSPLSDLTDFQEELYTKQISSLYSLFKKYIETKKHTQKVQKTKDVQEFPLGTIKMLIGQGKSLQDIADRFNIPKSTAAYKLKKYYQTSYSDLKDKMNIKN